MSQSCHGVTGVKVRRNSYEYYLGILSLSVRCCSTRNHDHTKDRLFFDVVIICKRHIFNTKKKSMLAFNNPAVESSKDRTLMMTVFLTWSLSFRLMRIFFTQMLVWRVMYFFIVVPILYLYPLLYPRSFLFHSVLGNSWGTTESAQEKLRPTEMKVI